MISVRHSASAIDRLLKPRSVAVVGASPTPGSLGANVIVNLERLNFTGDIHLINPKRDDIGGRPCLKSVMQLPMGVDVAVLAIPRAAVLPTIRELGSRQVGAAIVFSAGFAEGGEAGLKEQHELARLAQEHGMLIEGPNCLGLVNYVDGIALTFVDTPVVPLNGRPGLAVVSQSGAMAAVLSTMVSSRDLGLAYSISTGNEASSGVEDYLEYFLDNPHTQAIGMIVEHFRQPWRFLQLADRARSKGKLIALLHPGRSNAARESAATHTGAMAGDFAVMKTKVERAGVLLADSIEQLSDCLEIALHCRTMVSSAFKGGTAVLTESGAFKALTLDLAEQIGLSLPALSNADSPALRAAIPEFVPVSNPLDLTAQALVEPQLYQRTLAALLGDARIGSVVLGLIQTDPNTCALKFPVIIEALKTLKPDRPVIFAGIDEGAAVPLEYIRGLRALNVPYFPSTDRALRAVTKLHALAERDYQRASCDAFTPPKHLGTGVIPEYRAKQILRVVGIPFAQGEFVTTLEQASQAATRLGFPVVLKAQSADLSHKSDAGGVVLNLHNLDELSAGWQRLHDNIAKHRPGLALDGVLLEKMGERGVELIIGARNDGQWGPVILAGFGGVQAEILQDVRLLTPEMTHAGIVRELMQLKSAALLRGFRGSPALDVDAVANIITRLGKLMLAAPHIREVDLNPVMVYPQGQGAIALDALMLVDGQPKTLPKRCGR